MKHLLLFLLLSLLILSCGPQATFDEPQPAGAASLDKIPAELHGNYRGIDDSLMLSINNSSIVCTGYIHFKVKKDDAGEDVVLKGDTLIHKKDGSKELVKVIDDTIHVMIPYTDTLFHFSASNVLKKMKGEYYLNTSSFGSWMVQRIELDGNILTIGEIETDGLKKLRAMTDTPDTSDADFHLSKREFKKFVRNDGFSTTGRYRKINP